MEVVNLLSFEYKIIFGLRMDWFITVNDAGERDRNSLSFQTTSPRFVSKIKPCLGLQLAPALVHQTNKMNVPAEAFNRCLFFELLHASLIYEVSGMLLVLSNILDNIKFQV